jgi:hypothetical protein
MRHIEIHVIETELDAASAVACGLLSDPFFVTACADCGDDVGGLDRFEPYCIVLDDVTEWYLCTYCAEPVTDPDTVDSDWFASVDEEPTDSDDDEDDGRFVVIDD